MVTMDTTVEDMGEGTEEGMEGVTEEVTEVAINITITEEEDTDMVDIENIIIN